MPRYWQDPAFFDDDQGRLAAYGLEECFSVDGDGCPGGLWTNRTCEFGLDGVMCSVCEMGDDWSAPTHYFSKFGECLTCEDAKAFRAIMSVVVYGGIGALLFYRVGLKFKCFRRRKRVLKRRVRACKSWWQQCCCSRSCGGCCGRRCCKRCSPEKKKKQKKTKEERAKEKAKEERKQKSRSAWESVRVKLKSLVGTIQIMSSLTESLSIEWPDIVFGIDFQMYLGFMSLDFTGLPNMGCLTRNSFEGKPPTHSWRPRVLASLAPLARALSRLGLGRLSASASA